MSTHNEIAEFIYLWESLQNLTDQPDQIGSYCKFQPQTIWRAQPEGKYRLFTWLLLQRKVWQHVHFWAPNLVTLPEPHEGIQRWWRRSMQSAPKDKRRTIAALLMYTCWNMWNERNRRIFQGKLASPFVVFSFIKEEISWRQRACGAPMIT
ncbi:hypothetical protein SETIT_7G088000v2 [Setaria italica]|uniref:Reverse transcriptase zinc-binding domain-containing protein n=1 Tax=Setaria italica TaxID=4555 RepID=A0A368RTP2_SETIT|nr:hypothetical protein SETIT_7G088000v2 [Setaria italica]